MASPKVKKAITDLADSIKAGQHEAFAAGWNAFLATHSGLPFDSIYSGSASCEFARGLPAGYELPQRSGTSKPGRGRAFSQRNRGILLHRSMWLHASLASGIGSRSAEIANPAPSSASM